jgi:hypothetical protein
MNRVRCEPSLGGCGWWWYRRQVRPHWWSPARYEYDGAHYPEDGHDDPHPLRGQWLSEEQVENEYADCWVRIERQHVS